MYIYNAIKFLLLCFFLVTICYIAFSFIWFFSFETKTVLSITSVGIVVTLNYKKIFEELFASQVFSFDFVIYDLITIGSLVGIISVYFGIIFSIMIIYVTYYNGRDLDMLIVHFFKSLISIINV